VYRAQENAVEWSSAVAAQQSSAAAVRASQVLSVNGPLSELNRRLDAARVASLITEATPEADRLLEGLRSLPAAPSIVTELLSWPDGQVRFWALDAAERVFPRADYIKALKRATRDRDEVVRAEAVGQLADIAPEAVRPIARRLAAALQTDIPSGEKVFVLWTLAKIRSVDLIPAIEAFRQPLPDWWKLTRVADVVLTYLKDGEQVVLGMLEKALRPRAYGRTLHAGVARPGNASCSKCLGDRVSQCT
jgi:hypothetical protein